MKSILRSILFGGYSLPSLRADVGDLLLRAFVGLSLALAHGKAKLVSESFNKFAAGVSEMGFPAPKLFAALAVFAEFGGGLLLAAGLLTRPAGFLIACTMAVAAFIRHAKDDFGVKELALLYCAIAVCYMLRGAGRLSVDHIIRTTIDGESKGFDTH
jgi:putative oxidoreductase